MTDRNNKILNLQRDQKRKIKEIKKLKKRMWKHFILITLVLGGIVLYFIDDAYPTFGSVKNFLKLNIALLTAIIITYFLIIKYQSNKKENEIKEIKAKLYNLMKLKDG